MKGQPMKYNQYSYLSVDQTFLELKRECASTHLQKNCLNGFVPQRFTSPIKIQLSSLTWWLALTCQSIRRWSSNILPLVASQLLGFHYFVILKIEYFEKVHSDW